jgi:hypothetical protein
MEHCTDYTILQLAEPRLAAVWGRTFLIETMTNASSKPTTAAPKSRRMPWLKYVLLLAIVFAVYGCAYLYSTIESAEDVMECTVVADALASERSIPASISTPGRPAVFCDPGVRFLLLRRFDHVRVYGVIIGEDRRSIVNKLRAFHRVSKTKPILVEFYDRENWQTWSDSATGMKGGQRGPEHSVEKAFIN